MWCCRIVAATGVSGVFFGTTFAYLTILKKKNGSEIG